MNPGSLVARRWAPAGSGAKLVYRRDQDLAKVAGVLQQAWSAWARNWGLPIDTVVRCESASSMVATTARHFAGCGEALAWRLSDCGDIIGRTWFGGPAPVGSVAEEMVGLCERDAWARTATALGLEHLDEATPLRSQLAHRWSGAVIATLAFGTRLLLTSAAVERLLARTRGPSRCTAPARAQVPLARVHEALADLPCRLSVQLEGCELDIGTLRDLRVGDVLRIRHDLHAPAAVRTGEGTTLFNGFLACSRSRKAVELGSLGSTVSLAEGTP